MQCEKKKKTIILLVASLQQGGQERVAVNTAELLMNDYCVTLVVFDDSNMAYAPCCKVISLDIPAKDGTINKSINLVKRIKKLNSIIRKTNTDIVYSFGASANMVNAASTKKKKTILSIRGYKSAFLRPLEIQLYRRADIIVGVSKAITEVIKRRYSRLQEKVRTLYNPYDIDAVIRMSEENVDDYDFSKMTIISQGRLNKVKNFPRLIKAFYIVKKTRGDIQLLILGEGEERTTLESLITKYEIEDSVTLIGFRSNPFAYLARASLYVLSSYNEGFPNSLIEGMCFLPVVSVDCMSGPREILTTKYEKTETKGYEMTDYGVLVQPALNEEFCEEIIEDDMILANAILDILSDDRKKKELKDNARKRVETFSVEEYKSKLIDYLEA